MDGVSKILKRAEQLVGVIEEAMAKEGIPLGDADSTKSLGNILGTLWCMASDLLPTMNGDPLPPVMLFEGESSGMVMLTPLADPDVRNRRNVRTQIPAILSRAEGLKAAGYMNEAWMLELEVEEGGTFPERHGPVSEDDRRISVVFFNFATEHVEGTIRCKIEEGNGRKLQEEAKVMLNFVDGKPTLEMDKLENPKLAPPSMWPRGIYGDLVGLEMEEVDA